MKLNQDSDESEDDLEFGEFNMVDDLEQTQLSTSYDDAKAYFKSELDEITKSEFQNAEYLQEFSIDGTKLEYEQSTFKYYFPLRQTQLYYQPRIRDIFEFEMPEELETILSQEEKLKHKRGQPNCLASSHNKIAIGFIQPTNIIIWNESTRQHIQVLQTELLKDVVFLDLSQDSEILVAGFINGLIAIIDAMKGVIIQQFSEIHHERILALRLIYKFSQEQLVIASIDASGKSWITNFNKSFFKYEIKQNQFLNELNYPTTSMKYIVLNEDVRLMVVANIQKFLIYRIKIFRDGTIDLKNVLSRDNSMKIQKRQVFSSSCAIGRGLVKNSKKELERKFVAICAWDEVLFTVSSDKLDDVEASNFIFFDTQIIEVSFVRDSLFVVLTKNKGIIMMNTVNILNYAPNKKLIDTRFITFPETLRYEYIGQEIKIKGFYMTETQKRFRKAVQTLLKKTTLTIESCAPINYKPMFSQQITVLLQNKVVTTSLEKWHKLVMAFYEQGEWMNGMHYILSVFRGSNRFITQFLELNQLERYTLLKGTIDDISIKYHRMVMSVVTMERPEIEYSSEEQALELENNNCTLFSILIEFLLLTDSYDILFHQIMKQTTEIMKDNHKFFLQCLEPFYQECLVSQIPKDVLLEILETYKSQKRIDLIQKLIWSLDHTKLDPGFLIKLSLKLGLLKSLAIICSKGDAEVFQTPVVKMWSVILLLIQKTDFQIALYYCLRLLTLIKLALLGQDVLGRSIEENKLSEIIKTLVVWVLDEDNLEKLLTLAPASTFEVLQILLSTKLAPIINSIKKFKHDDYNSDFVRNFNLNTSKITVMVSKIIEKIIQEQSQFQKTLRSSSISETSKIQIEDIADDLTMHYTLFQIRLYYNNYISITNNRIIENLAYVLKNLRILNLLYLTELMGYLPYAKREELRKHQNLKEVIEYLQSCYLLLIIKKIEQNATEQEHKDIIQLSHQADLTSLSLVCIHLAEKKNEYRRALDFYLSSKNQLVRIKVFDWLFVAMEHLQMKDQTNFEEMKKALIQKITELIQINSEKTRDIFSRYNSESEKIVINKLELYPELQLEYVENVLKKERDQGHKVDNDLLILNITLLCKLNPDKILSEVKQYEYPLDNILPPCREFGIKKATAYVLERLGNIQESIRMYSELLIEFVKGHIKELIYNYDLSTKLGGVGNDKPSAIQALFNKGGAQNMMQSYQAAKEKAELEINQEIEIIIKTCLYNNKFDSSDEIWYIVMDTLIEIRDRYVTDYEAVFFLKELCTLQMCHIIATIAANSNLDILLLQLQERYVNLDLGQLKYTFQEIIYNYIYEQTVFSSAQKLIQDDILSRLYTVLDKYNKGVVGKYECTECHQDLTQEGKYAGDDDDDVVVFTCNHAYHRGCAVEQQGLIVCQICCHGDENYAYKILFLNPKIKLEKLTESLHVKSKNNGTLSNNDLDVNNLEDLMKGDDGVIKIKVSKDVEMKRKKRTNKLGYWDRKRTENLIIIEETNADIDAFNKRQKLEEERKLKQELDSKNKRRRNK